MGRWKPLVFYDNYGRVFKGRELVVSTLTELFIPLFNVDGYYVFPLCFLLGYSSHVELDGVAIWLLTNVLPQYVLFFL